MSRADHKIKEPGIVEGKDDQHRGNAKPIAIITALFQLSTPPCKEREFKTLGCLLAALSLQNDPWFVKNLL
jgi:hypothetical protein